MQGAVADVLDKSHFVEIGSLVGARGASRVQLTRDPRQEDMPTPHIRTQHLNVPKTIATRYSRELPPITLPARS